MRRECPCSEIPEFQEAYGAFPDKNTAYYKPYSENVSDPWELGQEGEDNSLYLRRILKNLKEQKLAGLKRENIKEEENRNKAIKDRLDKEEYLKALRDTQKAVEEKPEVFDSGTQHDLDNESTDVSDETRQYEVDETSEDENEQLRQLNLYESQLERLEELAGIENPTAEDLDEIDTIQIILNGILDEFNIGRPDNPTIFDYHELHFHF